MIHAFLQIVTRIRNFSITNVNDPFVCIILLDLGRFFNFLILYTVDSTLLTGYQAVARHLTTPKIRQTQNKRHTVIHALSGIRTHDPSVRASKDLCALIPDTK
jgi:hypothetical protein